MSVRLKKYFRGRTAVKASKVNALLTSITVFLLITSFATGIVYILNGNTTAEYTCYFTYLTGIILAICRMFIFGIEE